MGPESIIFVICAFNCFSNNSVRGHTIDPNQYFTLSFWDKKIKVTLQSDATKTVIFCLWLHPKPWEMCSICSAFEPSPPPRLVSGLSFPLKLAWAEFFFFFFGVCNVDHFFFKPLLNLLQYCICFMFQFLGHQACGILVPWPGIEPTPPGVEGKVLTTGPPGVPVLTFESTLQEVAD